MKKTAFHEANLSYSAQMREMFGYYLPWEYGPGHVKEHLGTRQAAATKSGNQPGSDDRGLAAATQAGDDATRFSDDGGMRLFVERRVDEKHDFISLHLFTSLGLVRPRDCEGSGPEQEMSLRSVAARRVLHNTQHDHAD